jgi:hypothetical protein
MKQRPACRKGKLDAKKKRATGKYAQLCGSKACNKWIVPHFGSPDFTVSSGSTFVSFRKQAGILHCTVWGVNQSLVPALIEDVKRFSVESVYKAWRHVLTHYVKGQQDKIKFVKSQVGIPRSIS